MARYLEKVNEIREIAECISMYYKDRHEPVHVSIDWDKELVRLDELCKSLSLEYTINDDSLCIGVDSWHLYSSSDADHKACTVKSWYDKRLRLWRIWAEDENCYQVGDAQYASGKKLMQWTVENMKQELELN